MSLGKLQRRVRVFLPVTDSQCGRADDYILKSAFDSSEKHSLAGKLTFRSSALPAVHLGEINEWIYLEVGWTRMRR